MEDPLLHRDSGIRTHDLLNPIQVRYQLRYVPLEEEKVTLEPGISREEGGRGVRTASGHAVPWGTMAEAVKIGGIVLSFSIFRCGRPLCWPGRWATGV